MEKRRVRKIKFVNEKAMPKAKSSEEKNREREDKIVDWTTYYRRNIHIFVEDYLGIRLKFFQKFMVYFMHLCPLVILLCSRGTSKSFITAVYACAVCILYPNSKVLIVALTKSQAGLIITNKIDKELIPKSPTLKEEIEGGKSTGGQNPLVKFKNGSFIKACVAGEQSRGERSTLIIVDEFRLVKKEIIDSIFSPTAEIRQTECMLLPQYEPYLDILEETPREVYLSSAYWKTNWMWEFVKQNTVNMFNTGDSFVFAIDYAISLKERLKSKKKLLKEKDSVSSFIFDMEYRNLMLGGSDDAFYTYDRLSPCQTLKKAFMPKTLDEFFGKKKQRFGLMDKKDKGEIRLITLDPATAESTKTSVNDNAIFHCLRAIPSGDKYIVSLVYTEKRHGTTLESQAIRCRQLMDDFQADLLVLDAKSIGREVLSQLHKNLQDEERSVVYTGIKSMNDKDLASTCKNPLAKPLVFTYTGTDRLNDELHQKTYQAIEQNKFKMLLTELRAEEDYFYITKSLVGEYSSLSLEEKERLLSPYKESDETINEMMNLRKEYIKDGRYLQLKEPSTGTKDRYMSLGMGLYYIFAIEEPKLQKEEGYTEEDMVDIPLLVNGIY